MRTSTNGHSRDGVTNTLLNAIPDSSCETLAPELVDLKSGFVLCEPEEDFEYVYFPNDALVSLVSLSSEGASIEIGLIGCRGMVGLPAILGGMTPYRAVVQMRGSAFRVKGVPFSNEFRRNRILQELLLRYTNAFLVQIAQSSICNCYHRLQERLCRWLLIARDGARSDSLPLTHDLIAHLLGARRASVTVAAGELQKAGFIKTGRGEITIVDPAGLEQMACECYRILKEDALQFQN